MKCVETPAQAAERLHQVKVLEDFFPKAFPTRAPDALGTTSSFSLSKVDWVNVIGRSYDVSKNGYIIDSVRSGDNYVSRRYEGFGDYTISYSGALWYHTNANPIGHNALVSNLAVSGESTVKPKATASVILELWDNYNLLAANPTAHNRQYDIATIYAAGRTKGLSLVDGVVDTSWVRGGRIVARRTGPITPANTAIYWQDIYAYSRVPNPAADSVFAWAAPSIVTATSDGGMGPLSSGGMSMLSSETSSRVNQQWIYGASDLFTERYMRGIAGLNVRFNPVSNAHPSSIDAVITLELW